jgi:two-component system, NarL family, sensor kinase
MKSPRHSITTKLLLIILFVGISSVLIVGIYSFYSARRAIINRTIDQLILVRSVKKQQIEFLFDVKIRNLVNLGHYPNPDRRLCSSFGFENLYLVNSHEDLEGIPGGSLRKEILKVCTHLKSGNETTVSDLFYKMPGDTLPVFLVGYRRNPDDPAGPKYLVAEVSSQEINHLMLNDNLRNGLGYSGESYLVGGDYLMRSRSRFIRHSILGVTVRSEAAEKAVSGQTGSSVTTDYRGIRVISAYAPLDLQGLPWVVLAEIDLEEAMIPVTALRNDILLFSVIIIILILGFARLISIMIIDPIIRLKNAVAGLGRGNYDGRVEFRSGDEIGMLAQTFNDMSDQLREERRQRLTALYDGQEMERRRISRELHDGLGQKLVGTKLQIENCDEADPRCLHLTMIEAKVQLHRIVEELHRISNDLMPAALNELGLEVALQNLCRDVAHQTGLEVEFDYVAETRPDEKISVYLYRICQEALLNAVKHAEAKYVSMQFLETRDSMLLIIEDDGKGFDQQQYQGGNGLPNMRDRAEMLGGTISIESSAGNGTTLRIKIPKSQ